MNVLITDINEKSLKKNKEACNINNKKVQKSIKEKYDERLFRSTDDIYMNNTGDRQFYTMPVTDIVNDQTGFAKWLYDRGPTCKEGAMNECWNNINDISLQAVGGNSGIS